MEQNNAIPSIEAAPEATVATASFFANLVAYVCSIAAVQVAIAFFSQMVLLLTSLLGVSLGAAYLLITVGSVAMAIGAWWIAAKIVKGCIWGYKRMSVWVQSWNDARKAKKVVQPAPVAVVTPEVAPVAAA